MKYTLKPTSKFQKDLKRIQKRSFFTRKVLRIKEKANIILSAKTQREDLNPGTLRFFCFRGRCHQPTRAAA